MIHAFELAIAIDAPWVAREYQSMSKLAPNQVAWTAPSATDLAGYNLRVVPAGQTLDYTVAAISVPKGATSYDFSTNSSFAGKQGLFDMGVSAVDTAGNESDMATLKGVSIDFVPPDPPTNFRRL